MSRYLECHKKNYLPAFTYRAERVKGWAVTVIYEARCQQCFKRLIGYEHSDEYGDFARSGGFHQADKKNREQYERLIDSGMAVPCARPTHDKATKGGMVASEYSHRAGSVDYVLHLLRQMNKPKRTFAL